MHETLRSHAPANFQQGSCSLKRKRVLLTGACGYIADQLLPGLRQQYELTLLDVRSDNHHGAAVQDVVVVDLLSAKPAELARSFKGVDAVLHLANCRASQAPVVAAPSAPPVMPNLLPGMPLGIDDYANEKQNLDLAYNVLRAAYEAGVPRVAVASSNRAADWYEHALIHTGLRDMLDPDDRPLSDTFYGWAKACIEHMGFVFACGAFGRKMGVVMIRIGAPHELILEQFQGDMLTYKRDLAAYVSPRDLTQLFSKAIDAPNIDDAHGIPWQVVYGISNNTRAFWSLASARRALGYRPKDDSELKYAGDVRTIQERVGATDSHIGRTNRPPEGA
jgi:hypothetical protein